jgi:hypothetical protein
MIEMVVVLIVVMMIMMMMMMMMVQFVFPCGPVSLRSHVSDITQHNHKDIEHTYPAPTAPLKIGTIHYITVYYET